MPVQEAGIRRITDATLEECGFWTFVFNLVREVATVPTIGTRILASIRDQGENTMAIAIKGVMFA